VLRALSTKLIAAQDFYTTAMAAGYRQEQSRRLRIDEAGRLLLIDALLYGRSFEQWSVWEAADYLQLPTTGPFVVIAAEAVSPGADALPIIEHKLRSLDVFSVWRRLPDLQVGIVHVVDDKHLGDVLSLVSRIATHRVGSACVSTICVTPRTPCDMRVSCSAQWLSPGRRSQCSTARSWPASPSAHRR
jgi:hypothetical protein